MVQSLLFGRPLFVRWEKNMMMKNMKIKMNLPLLDLSASPQVKSRKNNAAAEEGRKGA